MRLKVLRHLWGVNESLPNVVRKICAEGFEGIEWLVPPVVDEFQATLKANQLDYIALILTQGETVTEHLEFLRQTSERARPLEPLKITCHAGKDSWSRAESEQFFHEALEIEQRIGIPIGFETHRGRILFNPWITRDLLQQFPELKLCCDFSHWVLVCERLIDSEIDIIRQCAERCIHLHARVGSVEGPQVADPRAPESLPYLEAYERWWALVWEAQTAQGMEVSTLTPEYGPPPYQPLLPYTQMPVADLWAICHWQAEREKAYFAQTRERS